MSKDRKLFYISGYIAGTLTGIILSVIFSMENPTNIQENTLSDIRNEDGDRDIVIIQTCEQGWSRVLRVYTEGPITTKEYTEWK